MKLWDVLRKIGSRAITEAVPGGGLLIDAVNAVLPERHRLPTTATGAEAQDAINMLPASERAAVMAKQYDVAINEETQRNESIRAMLEADAKSTHTTRPYIARHSFHLLALATVGTVGALIYAIWKTDEPLIHLVNAWPLILSILAPFVAILRAYFGMITREHQNRLDTAAGHPTKPGGILNKLKEFYK